MICYDGSRSNVLLEDVVTMNPGSKRRSLPSGWPKKVNSAVLQVIALAHTAIVQARGIALNSPDARTRRAGDLPGVLEEIAMLEEERRIKDGRMALIDAHRRPYYRPTERMSILELRTARGWSQAETARQFLVNSRRKVQNVLADSTGSSRRDEVLGERLDVKDGNRADSLADPADDTIRRKKNLLYDSPIP